MIYVIVTGGTFDKEYNELDGTLYFKDTHLSEMLNLGRCRIPIHVETLMMKDSMCLTHADRTLIAKAINQREEEKIIITHGTDTMIKTAQFLSHKTKHKTIILVGAMIPYKFGSSDGLFNLGSAIAFVQTLPHGVYITMNGQYFTYDNCYKNMDVGEFKTLRDGKSEMDL